MGTFFNEAYDRPSSIDGVLPQKTNIGAELAAAISKFNNYPLGSEERKDAVRKIQGHFKFNDARVRSFIRKYGKYEIFEGEKSFYLRIPGSNSYIDLFEQSNSQDRKKSILSIPRLLHDLNIYNHMDKINSKYYVISGDDVCSQYGIKGDSKYTITEENYLICKGLVGDSELCFVPTRKGYLRLEKCLPINLTIARLGLPGMTGRQFVMLSEASDVKILNVVPEKELTGIARGQRSTHF